MSTARLLMLCALASAGLVAQAPLLQTANVPWNGPSAISTPPTSATAVGFINADDKMDVAVGHASDAPGGLLGAGSVHLVESRRGGVIASRNGSAAGAQAGYLATLIDANADTVADLALGEPGAAGGAGQVFVVSGTDLSTLQGPFVGQPGQGLGRGLVRLTSGFTEELVMVSTPGALVSVVEAVDLVSGQRRIITDNGGVVALWSSVLALQDVNGDGTSDLVFAAADFPLGTTPAAGRVIAISGIDGRQLWAAFGSGFGERFGKSMVRVDDQDGDGLDDLAVGAPGRTPFGGPAGAGEVRILSTRTGSLIRTIGGERAGGGFGDTAALMSDVDEDGSRELLVGSAGADGAAELHARSVRDGFVYTTVQGGVDTPAGREFRTGPIKSIAALVDAGEATGDAFVETLVLGSVESAGMTPVGAHWFMPIGAREFGNRPGEASEINPLRLEVLRYDQGNVNAQFLVRNGTAGGPGFIALSQRADDLPLLTGGGTFLVDFNDRSFASIPVTFNAFFSWITPQADLHVPALEGITLYAQAGDLSTNPINLTSRVEIRFHR